MNGYMRNEVLRWFIAAAFAGFSLKLGEQKTVKTDVDTEFIA